MKLADEQVNELRMIVYASLDKLYVLDKSLIRRHASERAIVFRFGVYMSQFLSQSSFKDYNLDCEYNRNGYDSKRTETFGAFGITPDLLLHKRETNSCNALVMEFKPYWDRRSRQTDELKIDELLLQDGLYKYGLGALVELEKESGIVTFKKVN